MVDWAMSTLPAAATFSSGLVIWRLFVSMMPFAMVKLPPRSLNAVLAPGPWRMSGTCPSPIELIISVRSMPSMAPSLTARLPWPCSVDLISSAVLPVPLS